MSDLNQMHIKWITEVNQALDLGALDRIRVAALGKTGEISQILKTLGSMAPEERKSFGAEVNRIKDDLSSTIKSRKSTLESEALSQRLRHEFTDLSLPAYPIPKGSIHPVSQVMDEMIQIFAQMGFEVAEGPDIEDDFHNFTALNFPPKHPARDMHDTFFLAPNLTARANFCGRTHRLFKYAP